MVKADQHVEQQEVVMLRRIVIGLAFPLNRVDMIVEHSIEMNLNEMDVDSFTDRILKLLKMR